MKKILHILLIFGIIIPSLIVPVNLQAQTLRDLKNELETLKKQLNEKQEEEKLTQKQIEQINTNITNINNTITQIGKDMIRLSDEIEQMKADIIIKEKEIVEIIGFIQLANGESAYLEYAFGARDFTDFIYRMAISEQLTEYNERLIKEYNDLIESNKNKQIELIKKEQDLKKEQESLSKELSKVRTKLDDIYDIYVDLGESIKNKESTIRMYEVDYKCPLDTDINICAKGALPPDTVFWRPTAYGTITSEYGNRSYWLNGKLVSDFHTGIDIGIPVGTPVYSAANGTVTALTIRYSCGGNMVFIHHNVNNQTYTSIYMHLYSINVKVGDTVNKNSIIGYSGGASTPWDACSTGAHLHFTLLNGKVGIDYNAWSSTFYAKLINPRTKVNFPWGSYSDRTTKY